MNKTKIPAIMAAMCAVAACADEAPVPPEPQSGASEGVLCALGCAGLALLFVLVHTMRRKSDRVL